MVALVLSQLVTVDAAALLEKLRAAPAAEYASFFADAKNATYLNRLAGRGKVNVSMIPVPPGWKASGKYWAIFSRPHGVQGTHDAVIEVRPDFKLGKEVPEWMDAGDRKPVEYIIDAKLDPATKSAEVKASVVLSAKGKAKALVFRLNENYDLLEVLEHIPGATGKRRVVKATGIPAPQTGDVVRAGGLIVFWTDSAPSPTFVYRGIPTGSDRVTDNLAYLTGGWVPWLSRLPARTRVTITGPKDWVLRSEGEYKTERSWTGSGLTNLPKGEWKAVVYQCDIPLTFPKIVGGKYILAAEKKEGGKTFRSWQFDPIDKARADFDVARMAEMAKFYSEKLVPWPFPGYECFDGDRFYGIESYSYTILAPNISSKYVGHEMGHTYFGGMAPCTYIKDTWNEGVTTYVDGMLTGRNLDNPFGQALTGLRDARPLSEMNFTSGSNNESYWRGGSVMKMLEQEIGLDAVLRGLRDIVTSRQGKDTTWPGLRAHFEKTSKQKLDWFWNQWITNGVFPKIDVAATTKPAPTATQPQRVIARVTVSQSGTPKPFRLKVPIVASNGELEYTKVVDLTTGSQTVEIPCETPVRWIIVRPTDYTLVHVPERFEIPR